MKKPAVFPLMVLILICMTAAALAGELVTDETGRLSDSEIAALTEIAEGIGEEYGINAMIRFVYSTPGYRTSESQSGYYGLRDYAADYYDSEHAGESGVIFAVRLEDRWYLSVTTGRAESILTTDALDAAEREAQPYLKRGDYYGAFRTYLNGIRTLLRRYENGERYPESTGGHYTGGTVQVREPMERLPEKLPIIGVLSALISGLVLLLVRRGMKTARKRIEAGDYVSQVRVTRRQDIYLYTTTTRRKIESSSSGSHGSGGHFGGGGGHGSSHGGRF